MHCLFMQRESKDPSKEHNANGSSGARAWQVPDHRRRLRSARGLWLMSVRPRPRSASARREPISTKRPQALNQPASKPSAGVDEPGVLNTVESERGRRSSIAFIKVLHFRPPDASLIHQESGRRMPNAARRTRPRERTVAARPASLSARCRSPSESSCFGCSLWTRWLFYCKCTSAPPTSYRRGGSDFGAEPLPARPFCSRLAVS